MAHREGVSTVLWLLGSFPQHHCIYQANVFCKGNLMSLNTKNKSLKEFSTYISYMYLIFIGEKSWNVYYPSRGQWQKGYCSSRKTTHRSWQMLQRDSRRNTWQQWRMAPLGKCRHNPRHFNTSFSLWLIFDEILDL